jgi:sarcosine oxidase subunit beta
MNPAGEYDVIVIGAGIQGCSTAFNLACRRRRVLLLEKGLAGRQASGANAGGVRRLYRDPAEVPLSLAAMEIWHRLEGLLGFSCGFKRVGQVKIAENDSDMGKLQARAALMQSLGYFHEELIDAPELYRMFPKLVPDCKGAMISRADGFAEPFLSTRAFLSAALAKGAQIRQRSAVQALEPIQGMWQVRCPDASYRAPVIVNCAGAWSDGIARMVGDRVPLTPEAPTMMVTARLPHFIDPVIGLVNRKLSFKQMPNGTLVIGGGHRSHLDMPREKTTINFNELKISAKTVTDLFPFLGQIPVIRCWAGIEGMLPDHLPVIGPSPGAAGVFHAFGFSAHGFQLGPVVGEIMADLVEQKPVSFCLEPFRIDRFPF